MAKRKVDINNKRSVDSLKQRLVNEGRPIVADLSITRPDATTVNAGAVIGTVTYTVQPGRKAIVGSIRLQADRPCKIVLTGERNGATGGVSLNASGRFYTRTVLLGKLSQETTIPFALEMQEGGSLSFAVTATEAAQEKPNVNIFPNGHEIGPFHLLGADKDILVLGDSRTWAPVVGMTGKGLFGNQIGRLCWRAGAFANINIQGYGGATSNMLAGDCNRGIYNTMPADVCIVLIGMNDAVPANGISTTLFTTNLTTIVQWWQDYFPGKPLILVGPGPTDDPGRSTLPAYNTAMQTVANDAGFGTSAHHVYYYDPAAAGANQLVLAASASGDPLFAEQVTNTRIHWRDAGHTKVANGLWVAHSAVILAALTGN